VNTREDEKAYYVEVDLPGVNKEDIHVDVNKDNLTISGERKYKEEVKEENYYKLESFFGKFQRSFTLPESIDSDAIEAKCDNGVLEVTIPKVTPKEAKKIQIL
jgi:HSP20 family protein